MAEAEEATVVAFRRHILLPLDDCLYALQPSIAAVDRRCVEGQALVMLRSIWHGWFWVQGGYA
jgi:hypothetical protein